MPRVLHELIACVIVSSMHIIARYIKPAHSHGRLNALRGGREAERSSSPLVRCLNKCTYLPDTWLEKSASARRICRSRAWYVRLRYSISWQLRGVQAAARGRQAFCAASVARGVFVSSTLQGDEYGSAHLESSLCGAGHELKATHLEAHLSAVCEVLNRGGHGNREDAGPDSGGEQATTGFCSCTNRGRSWPGLPVCQRMRGWIG